MERFCDFFTFGRNRDSLNRPQDLPVALSTRCLWINKFDLKVDPLAIHCLREYLVSWMATFSSFQNSLFVIVNCFSSLFVLVYVPWISLQIKMGGETPSRKRAWSLIHNKNPIVLFEWHCHATEKSEAIACARSCPSSRLARWSTQKRIMGKKWRAKEEEMHKIVTVRIKWKIIWFIPNYWGDNYFQMSTELPDFSCYSIPKRGKM
jgi:hypothetical protein